MSSISIPKRNCTRCHREYDATLEFFKAHPKGKYGLSSWCLKCHAEYRAEYRVKNQERHRQYNRDYHQAHKDERHAYYEANREHVLEYSRNYYQQNRDKHLAQNKAWRKRNPDYRRHKYWANPEKFRKQTQLSRRRNHSKVLMRNRIYKARKRNAEGHYSADDVALLLKSQKGLCWWCGCKLTSLYHVDHRIPLVRGGSNYPNNLCITCPECNLKKNSKLPHEWNGRLL